MRVVIITGEGRGKTTSALGLVLRAAGHGMRVCVVQFIKRDQMTGEAVALRMLPGVELHICGNGFVFADENQERFGHHVRCAQAAIELLKERLQAGFGMFVLDEICGAISLGLLELSTVLELLDSAPEQTIFVLTGRDAPSELIERADTVSRIASVKHGCSIGIKAQKGVEL